MTACVIEQQGTPDKFIGDALMAFWNTPFDVENHQPKAVKAAIDRQKKLSDVRPQFQEEFGIELKMGAGIHTGIAQVGNMGSSDLLNYTCIDDNVNLASRLESLCKRYGVGIVVSADIVEACPDDMPFRQLDKIRVKRTPGHWVFSRQLYQKLTSVKKRNGTRLWKHISGAILLGLKSFLNRCKITDSSQSPAPSLLNVSSS